MTVQMSMSKLQIGALKDNPKGLAKGSERSLKPAKEAFKAKLRVSTANPKLKPRRKAFFATPFDIDDNQCIYIYTYDITYVCIFIR